MSARPVLALVATAAVVLLAGCSGAASAPDASSDWSDSPLNTYLAVVWGSDIDEEAAQEQSRRVEELVAECMTEEGFEYTPQTQSTSFSSDEWKPDDREWVAEWGYGAVKWPGQDAAESAEPADDPNSEYVSTLSESESTAYHEVLYGPQPTEEELAANDGMWTSSWEEQGCYGAASHEVHGDDATQSDEHKPLMDAINAFYTTQADDPGLAEVDAAWADCMAAAGQGGLTRQADAAQSIYDRMNEFYESQTEYTEDPPELDALHDDEVELALVDFDCRDETDYQAKSRAVQWAAEDEFIADHRAELDALVADAEQARAGK